MKNFINRGMRLAALVLMLGVSTNALAKSINLYDQPKAESKVIGTADSDAGIITIFTPKDGSAWVKVADPRNGNVGWVKTSDLNGVGMHVNVMQTGNGANGYRIIQVGGSPEQVEAMAKRLQMQQQDIQKNINKMMGDIYKNMDEYWKNVPVMMPVIVSPQASQPSRPSPAASAQQAPRVVK